MRTLTVKRGLDLPIDGEPEQRIDSAPLPGSVALLGADYVGMRPTMAVAPGRRVKIGQPLFADKKTPGVVFTSPGFGTIVSVNRGRRRAFLSIVIGLDETLSDDDYVTFDTCSESRLGSLAQSEAAGLLVRSGAWTAFRTRPFSRIPSPHDTPHSIFVTAIDTNPLAADPQVILAERGGDFLFGLKAIARLGAEKVYVCQSPDAEIPLVKSPHPSSSDIETVAFRGPHPAGLPGTHIHMLDPVGRYKTAWHIGYQDVAAIGHLFRTGRVDTSRVVSLAGPAVKRPRLIRTRLGTNLSDLTAGQIVVNSQATGGVRLISGSVLSGNDATTQPEEIATSGSPSDNPIGFLGRYHVQVSAVLEHEHRELFGWIMPGFGKYSLRNVVASKLLGRKRFGMDTALHGGHRAIVPIGSYERVMPLDILPTFLFRALSCGDVEQSESLGCLELDEEDLALSTFVCPGKIDFGPMLRSVLTNIEKEG